MLQMFLTSLLSWYIFIPAAFACFTPMRNQLRLKPSTLILHSMFLFIPMLVLISFLEAYFSLEFYAMLPYVSVLAFIYYHKNLKCPMYKSLFIFILMAAFISFTSNIANGFDARLHPHSTLNDFSLAAAVFRAVLSTATCLFACYPLRRFGRRLIDHFDLPRVYYASIPVWCIFLAFNVLIAPKKYETLYVNYVQRTFWGILTLLFLLLCLLCVWFYYIVSDMMKKTETDERNRFLEMQESAYLSQQRYIKETVKARHDFKHAIGTLRSLVMAGELDAVTTYLDDYLAIQPINDTVSFCENPAVNALLNYYYSMAKSAGIPMEWEISLPDSLKISNVDICCVLGNVLENAIHACESLSESERFIDLAVRSEDDRLYLVISNSFDGNVRVKDGEYLSTKKHGSGLGLKSVRETAERYGGIARFTHDDTEFHTDVMLKTKSKETL